MGDDGIDLEKRVASLELRLGDLLRKKLPKRDVEHLRQKHDLSFPTVNQFGEEEWPRGKNKHLKVSTSGGYMSTFQNISQRVQGRERLRLRHHTNNVWCLLKVGEVIFAGSNDNSVSKIQEAGEKMEVQHFHKNPNFPKNLLPFRNHLDGHTGCVMCMCFTRNLLLSGSADSTVGVWDASTGRFLRFLKGHTGPIRSMVITIGDGRYFLFCGSWDKSISVWDVTSEDAERWIQIDTLTGHGGEVNCMGTWNNRVFSGDDTGVIFVWHLLPLPWKSTESSVAGPDLCTIKTAMVERILEDNSASRPSAIYCMEITADTMLTGNSEGYFVLWDLRSFTPQKSINAVGRNRQSIWCCARLGESLLLTGSMRRGSESDLQACEICVWDLWTWNCRSKFCQDNDVYALLVKGTEVWAAIGQEIVVFT